MAKIEYPKLRHVEVFPVQTEHGQMVGLRDPSAIAAEMLILSPDVFYLLQFCDGKHSARDLQEEYSLAYGGSLQDEQLAQILDQLDSYLFLDNQNFVARRKSIEKEFLDLPVRPAAHAGQSYEANPQKLEQQIDRFFRSSQGAGMPESNGKPKRLKALLAPHIDIRAGGPCYSHAYRALAESEGADCFVILGTGHSGLKGLYSALAKDFETPLGPVKHDAEFIDLLRHHYPDLARSEPLPHKNEHVIEFQLVFLKYLYGKQRTFTFVPILCSFSYEMLTDPAFAREQKIIARFSQALKKTIAQCGKKVCVIASVDFSHVGPRYGDEKPPDETFVQEVTGFDNALIGHIEKMDAQSFCQTVAQHRDRYRVCGFSSIYTMLNAIEARKGKLLNYANAEVDSQNSLVTFASMVFH
ncbi:MAG: AmmeMemoRadiSam system protein B [bacterium]